jgi:hypothetical protein
MYILIVFCSPPSYFSDSYFSDSCLQKHNIVVDESILKNALARARPTPGQTPGLNQARELLTHLIELQQQGKMRFAFDTEEYVGGVLRLTRIFFTSADSLELFESFSDCIGIDGTFGTNRYFFFEWIMLSVIFNLIFFIYLDRILL